MWVTPCWSILEFLKNQVVKIKFDKLDFLACKNQFRNWFSQATQAVKIPVWNRQVRWTKSWIFQIDFFRNQVQINRGIGKKVQYVYVNVMNRVWSTIYSAMSTSILNLSSNLLITIELFWATTDEENKSMGIPSGGLNQGLLGRLHLYSNFTVSNCTF